MTSGAGKAMEEVLKRVENVNTLLGQIHMASDEQSNGISQVTTAVAELDRATQHNSTFVNSMRISAENLRKQIEILTEVIMGFKLPENIPRQIIMLCKIGLKAVYKPLDLKLSKIQLLGRIPAPQTFFNNSLNDGKTVKFIV